ncbi:GNAT family N-acetyltransferase [Litorisediminicola beolgyonensis]|uniref:GNAT family N-acetyltransferase n=1 Tax=Litorisediminicola beolgyonensis TaxID=1173614 RepID=A0ABW3ZI72_9RHOB
MTKHDLPPLPTDTALEVQSVKSLAALDALETDWDRLFRRDPDANACLSHAWIRASFAARPERGFVLAVRDAQGTLIGLLPLKQRLHWSRSRRRFETQFEAGGRLSMSPYSGLLCDPTREDDVLDALASALAARPWARLSLLYFGPEPRARSFGAALEGEGIEVAWRGYRDPGDQSDKLAAALIPLPERLETFLGALPDRGLARQYAAWRRSNGRVFSAHAERGDALDTIEPDFLEFFDAACPPGTRERWTRYRPSLETAAATDRLSLAWLERGGRIAAVAAHLVDPDLGDTLRLFSAAPDGSDGAIAGYFLTLSVIDRAISDGGMSYDFGRDAAQIARHFACEHRPGTYLVAERPEGGAPCLDPRATGAALDRIGGFLDRNRIKDARAACAQLRTLHR